MRCLLFKNVYRAPRRQRRRRVPQALAAQSLPAGRQRKTPPSGENRCQPARGSETADSAPLEGMDRVVRTLAERQFGVVGRFQLLARGFSPATVCSYVDQGWLIPVYAGVYALGHRVLPPRGLLLAAVLAYGPHALLSHKCAGAEWQLLSTNQVNVDVTVPGTSRRSRRGIRVHRARQLHAEDVTKLHGIPITSVPRTIVDLGGVLTPRRHLEVIEQADRERVLDLVAVQRTLARRPHVRGAASLRRILADYTGAPDTRSILERRFLALIERAGLPRPRLNFKIGDLTVDACWPQWRLVVEIDSRAYHLGPRAFEADRLRDAKLQRLGYRVLRVTSRRMATPQQVLDDTLALAALAA
jgi:Protein of unknown function (DUF559)